MLLWKRYGNNKMAAMRYYVLHLQQYSHRLNLLYFYYTLLQTISIFSTTVDYKLHSYYTYFSCIIIIIIIIIAILFALFRKSYCVKNRLYVRFFGCNVKVSLCQAIYNH